MTLAVVGGVGFGFGLWLVVTGLWPAPEPLADALARLGQPTRATQPEANGFDERLGYWVARQSVVRKVLDRLAADLRLLHRTPDQLATELAVHAVLGFLFAPVVAIGAVMLGIDVPPIVPLWLALTGAGVAVVVPYHGTRSQAAKARAAFGHALSAYCDVAGMSMASGREVYAALFEAGAAGDGPAFADLREVLHTGFLAGDKPWDSLRSLGEEVGLDDLIELGATLALAGEEGAAVRDTVASRARSIRERLIADSEKDASAATERMAVPGVMLMVGFLWFLTFPALVLIMRPAP